MTETEQLLKSLNVSRGRIKTAITKFSKFVNDLLFLPRPLDTTTTLKIEANLERIIPKHDEFSALHYKICDLQEQEDDDELQVFEEAYFDVVANARALVKEYNNSRVQAAVNDADNASSSLGVNSLSDALSEAKIKLPTIGLPTFNGRPEQWLEFRDTFQALIHNDDSLSNIQKFYYLKSSLQGDARLVIHGIETSADNYQIAWGNLCERYENKRLLIQNHLSAIHNIPNINKESAAQLHELLDKLNQHLRALTSLGQPVEHWDTIIIYIVCSKLDSVTVRDWELKQDRNEMPTLAKLRSFLGNKANMLESLQYKRDMKPNNVTKVNKDAKATSNNKTFAASEFKCYYCRGDHAIYACDSFKKLNVHARITEVAKLKLCANCLKPGHQAKNCLRGGCKLCKYKHNSLMHLGSENRSVQGGSVQGGSVQGGSETETTLSMHSSNIPSKNYVLLSTALVDAFSERGNSHSCRVLLDNGSQSNFISEQTVKHLGLRYQRLSKTVGGLYNTATQVKGQCTLQIQSKDRSFNANITCLILPEISDVMLPQFKLPIADMPIPSSISLADPNFGTPGSIDVLIGASNFWQIVQGEITELGDGKPVLVKTHLGWIVSGSIVIPQTFFQNKSFFESDRLICDDLTKFWEVEEFPQSLALSDEETYCEDHFLSTVQRDIDGRFIVGIPYKSSLDQLGSSKDGAQRRFMSLERKLANNPELSLKYYDFMREYEDLGHMTCVPEVEPGQKEYFLPHHGVINEGSTTTKLRVVFDGSFATTTGLSRNNLECVGPMIQSDLLSILIRFRSHKIAISADIAKMYRQVQVRPEDRTMQQVLWRANPASSIKTFRLNTLTYGTSSASFLATRCLVELANINDHTDPAIATIIREDFYVDDVLTGADTEAEGQLLCEKLDNILKSACFPLRKWTSNVPTILSQVLDPEDPERIVSFGSGERTKTLGLHWLPCEDRLSFTIAIEKTAKITKRSILSSISQIFDPLGLVGACVITVKILLQELWKCKLEWDSEVPANIAHTWIIFQADLSCLNDLRIPRFSMASDALKLELHGFADASEKAYGACVYIRSETQSGEVIANLLCAKSKVAPLKTLTVPRLELCAALILAKLTREVCSSLRISFDSVHLWSDSMIVLSWLKKPPNLLKIFASNRVAKINDITKGCTWHHVPTKDNPADLISRGLQPRELLESSLWWNGPAWLLQNYNYWPDTKISEVLDLPETRIKVYLSPTLLHNLFDFSRFSNYMRLIRSASYVLRFIECCRNKKSRRDNGSLSSNEIANGTTLLIRIVQREVFASEIDLLAKGKSLQTSSKLLSMAPYLDKEGLLRVGGRLQNSELCFESKHPLLLPANHLFTKLLFNFEHKRLGHAGPQLLLCSIRDRFWPLRGRGVARNIVRNCVMCYKARPFNNNPLMGNLPSSRVRPSYVFENTGVDYAGPLTIKDRKGRGCKTSKCYIALFICFATKAVHLEVVSDLSTETFISSFKRFISRRGMPRAVWSDNGTNFVGADNELRRIIRSLNKGAIKDAFSSDQISWHFIPANSPHFGGLWESGVRGTKFHLKRIMANACLTFEELSTMCCQVEAFLNSRPLVPLSDDPNDLEALTPSHFLIGRMLMGLPEENLMTTPVNRLSRLQLVQQLSQQFWKRWSAEYLNTLQSRTKWKTATAPLTNGCLVMIKDDNQVPLKWPLARVIEVHPGKDGIIRVATVRTTKGILKRAVTKLFPLPLEESQLQDLESHPN